MLSDALIPRMLNLDSGQGVVFTGWLLHAGAMGREGELGARLHVELGPPGCKVDHDTTFPGAQLGVRSVEVNKLIVNPNGLAPNAKKQRTT